MSTSPITTHVLDTARGKPAEGVPISLSKRDADGSLQELSSSVTNSDGRVADLLEAGSLEPGQYRVTFDTGVYFDASGTDSFYPIVHVDFEIRSPDQHYHIPLLLSPYGYSTYRGS